MSKVIVITGASSGFGALTVRALSQAGHRVYAGMRETTARNTPQVEAARSFAEEHGVDLHPIEMDVASQSSVDAAIAQIKQANPGHGDPQRRPHGLRSIGSIHPGAAGRTLRRQRSWHAASQSRCPPPLEGAGRRAGYLGIEQQHPRRNSAILGPLLRRQGRHGCTRGELRQRVP